MLDCRACVPFEKAHDTVRVQLKPEALVERWDAGDGRFVELHEGDRLLVGAKTQAEADELVQLWQERKQRSEASQAREEEPLQRTDGPAESCSLPNAPQDSAEETTSEAAAQQREEADEEEDVPSEALPSQVQEQHEAEMRLAQKAREADMLRQKEEEECARRQAKEKEQQRRVEEFLHANGFVALDHAKRVQDAWFLPFRARTVYPIHVAAESGDAGMVEMLIQEGADPAQRTSNGKIASQLARKRNKGGSHDAVLRVLSSKAAPCGGA